MRHHVEIEKPDPVTLLTELKSPIKTGELNVVCILDKQTPCIIARVGVDTKNPKGKQVLYALVSLEKATHIVLIPDHLENILNCVKELVEAERISNIETYDCMDDLMGYLVEWEDA